MGQKGNPSDNVSLDTVPRLVHLEPATVYSCDDQDKCRDLLYPSIGLCRLEALGLLLFVVV